MHDSTDLHRIRAELTRIGLRLEDAPWGLASSGPEAVEEFIAFLRTLPEGAGWRDVFPDIPAHWDLDDEETWTMPYGPMGPWDYQALPAGPVVMISWPRASFTDHLDRLLVDARAAGFAVYGAGAIDVQNPDFDDQPVRIVLDHRTTEAELQRFTDWVQTHTDASFDGISRGVGERYAP